MSTVYTLLPELSIVGIKIVDIILSIIFDIIAFALSWDIGEINLSSSSRQILH